MSEYALCFLFVKYTLCFLLPSDEDRRIKGEEGLRGHVPMLMPWDWDVAL